MELRADCIRKNERNHRLTDHGGSRNSADIAALLARRDRCDACAVPAASVVGEAMVSFVLADAICTQFHADSMTDLTASLAAYRERLESRWMNR